MVTSGGEDTRRERSSDALRRAWDAFGVVDRISGVLAVVVVVGAAVLRDLRLALFVFVGTVLLALLVILVRVRSHRRAETGRIALERAHAQREEAVRSLAERERVTKGREFNATVAHWRDAIADPAVNAAHELLGRYVSEWIDRNRAEPANNYLVELVRSHVLMADRHARDHLIADPMSDDEAATIEAVVGFMSAYETDVEWTIRFAGLLDHDVTLDHEYRRWREMDAVMVQRLRDMRARVGYERLEVAMRSVTIRDDLRR